MTARKQPLKPKGRAFRQAMREKQKPKPRKAWPEGAKVGDGTPGPGRKPGIQAKLTLEVRDMVLEALFLAGIDVVADVLYRKSKDDGSLKFETYEDAWDYARSDGAGAVDYLRKQAKDNPKPFMTLVGKLMPQKIEADIQVMTNEMAARISQGRDRIAAMKHKLIEGTAEDVKDSD